jgi:Protein of unknown function (DUF3489)
MSKIGKHEQQLREMREQQSKGKQVAKAIAAMAQPDVTTESKTMRKKTKAANGKRKRGNKTERIMALLKREQGCTRAEVLKATGWPSISMPATAKAAGLKLKREKAKGQPTRYYAA